jgi:hypothetical protein
MEVIGITLYADMCGCDLINGPTPKMLIAFMSVLEHKHGDWESEQLIVCAELQSTISKQVNACWLGLRLTHERRQVYTPFKKYIKEL